MCRFQNTKENECLRFPGCKSTEHCCTVSREAGFNPRGGTGGQMPPKDFSCPPPPPKHMTPSTIPLLPSQMCPPPPPPKFLQLLILPPQGRMSRLNAEWAHLLLPMTDFIQPYTQMFYVNSNFKITVHQNALQSYIVPGVT